jgi:catechol 2,3-dioxygenase-like lactoylglutathione lyase family enzyme
LIPVLAVSDPEAACAMLARVFGFEPRENGMMLFGSHAVVVVSIGAVPCGMLRMPLDHVAFSVTDADQACLQFMTRGGKLARLFTPDGPKDIPEFWDHGVRFVFFDGPDGWPFEFCMKKGCAGGEGHDHFAIRKADIATAITALSSIGCMPVAHHRLGRGERSVEVQFMALGSHMFEVFAEGPYPDIDADRGWIGLLPS